MSQFIVQPEYFNRFQMSSQGAAQSPAPPSNVVQQPPEPRSSIQEPDWENATPKQLADYVVAKTMEEVGRQLGTQVQHVERRVERIDAQQQIRETAAKYPDYWTYREMMAAISRKYPTMHAEDVYLLAKSRAAQYVDQKRGQGQTQQRRQAPANRGNQSTERSGISPGSTATGSVPTSRAAEVAFEKIFGKRG